MKEKLVFSLILLGSVFLFNSATLDERLLQGDYLPIFMERSELNNSVFFDEKNRELINPGKIYSKNQYIFINEKYKGIHIIDNSNPASPKQTGFIVAPGCIDMAIKDNVLYLDNAVDLVAFNLETKQVTERIVDVFPEPLSPQNQYLRGSRPQEMILVGWKKKNE